MEITKSHWLHWYFPAMTPWKPYSRNYDQSWEPSAGSLIRTPWWSFLSWEKFGQNKSQALPKLATYHVVEHVGAGDLAQLLDHPVLGQLSALGALCPSLFDRRGDVSFCYILAADDARPSLFDRRGDVGTRKAAASNGT